MGGFGRLFGAVVFHSHVLIGEEVIVRPFAVLLLETWFFCEMAGRANMEMWLSSLGVLLLARDQRIYMLCKAAAILLIFSLTLFSNFV